MDRTLQHKDKELLLSNRCAILKFVGETEFIPVAFSNRS